MNRIKLKDRILQLNTKGEEIFNMTSHIVGGALGVIATVLCVVVAAIHNNVYGIVSGAIYGVTMILLYTMSSIYHGLKPNLTAKKVFQCYRSLYNFFYYCWFLYTVSFMHVIEYSHVYDGACLLLFGVQAILGVY